MSKLLHFHLVSQPTSPMLFQSIKERIQENARMLLAYLDNDDQEYLRQLVAQTEVFLSSKELPSSLSAQFSSLLKHYRNLSQDLDAEFEILGEIEFLHETILTHKTAQNKTASVPSETRPLTTEAYELLDDFVEETIEQLSNLTEQLLELELYPKQESVLNQAFRAIHTIKGSAGFLNLNKIIELTHIAEELLSKARSKKLVLQKQHISLLLEMTSQLERSTLRLQKNKVDDSDFSKLIEKFKNSDQIQSDDSEIPKHPYKAKAVFDVYRPYFTPLKTETIDILDAFVEDTQEQHQEYIHQLQLFYEFPFDTPIEPLFRFAHNLKNNAQTLDLHLLYQLAFASEAIIFQFYEVQQSSKEHVSELCAIATAIERALQNLHLFQREAEETEASILSRLKDLSEVKIPVRNTSHSRKAKKGNTLRVHVETLNRLMMLTTELLITKNRFETLLEDKKTPEIEALQYDLNSLAHRLQEQVSSARLQPISLAFRKTTRVARETAQKTKKLVSVQFEEDDITLDKYIVDGLQSPILQIIQNAIDHGIEYPAERRKRGKPQNGNILVKAQITGTQCRICIQDDGNGLDIEKIRETALKKGIYTRAELDSLTKMQTYNLIFLPGFSTRRQTSQISGRGVGMDIVKEKIDALRGSIFVESTPHRGSTFIIEIPLSLSLSTTLQIKTQTTPLLIPQRLIKEIRRIQPEDILNIQKQAYSSYQNTNIPLIELHKVLQTPKTQHNNYAIICSTNNHLFGLLVPQIGDLIDVTIQSLPPLLRPIEIYQGMTILSNGIPALILDIKCIAEQYDLLGHLDPINKTQQQTLHFYLLFYLNNTLYALPLQSIQTLERFQRRNMSVRQAKPYYQKRGASVPLAQFESLEEEPQYVLFVKNQIEYALSIGSIVDIYSCDVPHKHSGQNPKIFGTITHKKQYIPILNPKNLYDAL